MGFVKVMFYNKYLFDKYWNYTKEQTKHNIYMATYIQYIKLVSGQDNKSTDTIIPEFWSLQTTTIMIYPKKTPTSWENLHKDVVSKWFIFVRHIFIINKT